MPPLEEQKPNTYDPENNITSPSLPPPKQARSWWKIVLTVVGIALIIAGVLFMLLLAALWWSFSSKPSDNPLNDQKALYKIILKEAIADASIGRPTQRSINADGCSLGWKNTETCTFDAYFYYRAESDAEKAKVQLVQKGWTPNEDQESTYESDYYHSLGNYVKTIKGKLVCASLKASKDSDEVYVYIDAYECRDFKKLKSEAYAGWLQYIPSNVPARYIWQRQSTPLYEGAVTLEYRTQGDMSSDSQARGIKLEVEQYKLTPAYSPPQHCPITYETGKPDVMDACALRLTTPKGTAVYTSIEYDDPGFQYHYIGLGNTWMIIREWETSEALTDEELSAFVDSFEPIEPDELRKIYQPLSDR